MHLLVGNPTAQSGRNRERILADETTALARSKPHYLDEDFDTIHEAVLETARDELRFLTLRL